MEILRRARHARTQHRNNPGAVYHDEVDDGDDDEAIC